MDIKDFIKNELKKQIKKQYVVCVKIYNGDYLYLGWDGDIIRDDQDEMSFIKTFNNKKDAVKFAKSYKYKDFEIMDNVYFKFKFDNDNIYNNVNDNLDEVFDEILENLK